MFPFRVGIADVVPKSIAHRHLGRFTTETEIELAAEALIGAWKSLTP
ncbi:MAG TPA: hypothetical protein VIN38_14595 [Thiobacillus sp.]